MNIKSKYLFLLLPALLACGNSNQQAPQGPPPTKVTVQQVTKANVSYDEEYPAIVTAQNEVELRAQIGGYITGIYFKEGEKVKKGQKLYTIDSQKSEASYQEALANLALQEANLDKAKKDVERYRDLDKQDAIAKQQVDYAETAYASAQKQVDAAKAAVRSVQTNVRYTTIKAPFDGTIGISSVRLGASISPGQTLLNTISQDDPIAVDIAVDQNEIYSFSQLLNKKHEKNDSTFRLVLGREIYPHYGTISVIDRAVDQGTGTIRMQLIFPNPKNILRVGMSCTLKVNTESHDVIVIPYKAIVEQLGEFFVYIADGDKATQRRVMPGKQVDNDIIIKSGLKAGEKIITEGVQSLREGSVIAATPSPANQ